MLTSFETVSGKRQSVVVLSILEVVRLVSAYLSIGNSPANIPLFVRLRFLRPRTTSLWYGVVCNDVQVGYNNLTLNPFEAFIFLLQCAIRLVYFVM